MQATGGVNSTPHRARITHANIFSRVAQAYELHLFVCPLKTVISHGRMSCFAPCLIPHFSGCSTTLDLSVPALSCKQGKSLCYSARTLVWPFPRTARSLKTEDSLRFELGSDEDGRSEKIHPPHDRKQQAPPQSAFDAFGLGGREADGSSSYVSSIDEEKATEGRARVPR